MAEGPLGEGTVGPAPAPAAARRSCHAPESPERSAEGASTMKGLAAAAAFVLIIALLVAALYAYTQTPLF